jgi:hypothetical protein
VWGCKMLSAVVPRACFGDKTITKDSLFIILTVCAAAHTPTLRSFCLGLQTTGLIKQTLPIYVSKLAGPVYQHSFHESRIGILKHAGDQWDYPSDLAPLFRLDFPSLDFLTLLGVSSIIDPAPHCPGQNARIGE